MKTIRYVACMAALLFGAGPAFADCAANACNDVRITKLYVDASGPVYIKTSGNQSLLNCSLESGVYITLNMSSPNAKELYSLLLSAHLQGKTVMIRTVEGSQGCIIAYMISDN